MGNLLEGSTFMRKRKDFENDPLIRNAIERNLIEIHGERIAYNIHQKKSYDWRDPEEWVRARTIAFLVLEKAYPPSNIRTEVVVPRRTPEDLADIVVYSDERCQIPYLVVENKREAISEKDRKQAIEQLFGNANSLRASIALLDCYTDSLFFDVANYPSTERKENIKGTRDTLPEQYGQIPEFTYIAGPGNNDIHAVSTHQLESKVKRAHSLIWAGGKRDPLLAFDEWSKLMLAKVEDERRTPNNSPRRFQVGSNESYVSVATRIHGLFKQACMSDPSIFPENIGINLSDKKIVEVVKILQDICITDTAVDNIGAAFEIFFGSIFRGELGQYFTMRPIARFTVAMLDINKDQYVIDPTCGSGGFLLEVLLQVWNKMTKDFAGRHDLERTKTDFAMNQVYGIEIHEILARICKINLLLHHDGHTNIEGDRSCLDNEFTKARLKLGEEIFDVVVGNPPFGDVIKEGDEDQLGKNSLENFEISKGKRKIPSEHIIIEKSVRLLRNDGLMGFVLPDGVFNNQGEQSDCPQLRNYLVKNGRILAVISLPDYAFRKSGAQNKTSILFYKKFNYEERTSFNNIYETQIELGSSEDCAIEKALASNSYRVFMAEAGCVGYSSAGALISTNDLYRGYAGGHLDENQKGTILGEYRRFCNDPLNYKAEKEDCAGLDFYEVWKAHESHRLDPKYHLFKVQEHQNLPDGWVRKKITELMVRRDELAHPEKQPEDTVVVMTLSQTGDIRPREAGKGINPPEWLGMYFENSASTWYRAHYGDLVYSSIDLWKGCIAVVPEAFEGALVTKEYPIYRMLTDEITPDFLAILLRSRYYQRAFRAITTGHSNRRRTQSRDFEDIEVCYPKDKKIQCQLISDILQAKESRRKADTNLHNAILKFSNVIDGREDDVFELNFDDFGED